MNICMYASANALGPEYTVPVKALCDQLASHGCGLVFGGYAVGLMKVAADAFYAHGAPITGVVTDFFDRTQARHPGLTDVIICRTLSERKDEMARVSQAFIALPGGIGTLDEIFSTLCQKSCGQIDGEIIFYNAARFWSTAVQMLREMKDKGFIRPDLDGAYRVCDTPQEVLYALGLAK